MLQRTLNNDFSCTELRQRIAALCAARDAGTSAAAALPQTPPVSPRRLNDEQAHDAIIDVRSQLALRRHSGHTFDQERISRLLALLDD